MCLLSMHVCLRLTPFRTPFEQFREVKRGFNEGAKATLNISNQLKARKYGCMFPFFDSYEQLCLQGVQGLELTETKQAFEANNKNISPILYIIEYIENLFSAIAHFIKPYRDPVHL